MADTGLYLPLRLYTSQEETSLFRGECQDFLHNEYFRCPVGQLLPFQSEYPITSISLASCDGEEISDLGLDVGDIDEITFELGGVSYTNYIFKGDTISGVEEGLYQVVMETGIGSLVQFSDPIYFYEETEPLVLLKYNNNDRLGNILFPAGYNAYCWIDSYVEKPEYPIVTETRQDGDGDDHRVFQRWSKRRRIRFRGVESMADAMSLLPLMDYVEIDSERVYDVITNITWEEEYSCLADIEITFLTKKIAKSF